MNEIQIDPSTFHPLVKNISGQALYFTFGQQGAHLANNAEATLLDDADAVAQAVEWAK